ncbi:hypothetical protein D9753_25700 [Streptomyces dangxiongensis]|uniref:Uncharacterized protein n=1 Tax=Streptomyces dangxiongensis TaxID=1442032 RepID=A0A3G2JPH4_9ACTN|nr:hypothetical protein [Streptomyces dangxiongensis]AYN41707.1 hypothetical protein D9753_25700 [Streptomyces dangxiongensis]
MLPNSSDDDTSDRLVIEAEEVTEALAGVLAEAGIQLPRLVGITAIGPTAPREEREWLVQLGQCNVRAGLALYNLLRDGMTLRQKHPEESINAR